LSFPERAGIRQPFFAFARQPVRSAALNIRESRVGCANLREVILGGNDMVKMTDNAVTKVKEIIDTQEPRPSGLRISVVGGGCSGFSYSMAFENTPNMLDKTYNYDGLKIFVDQASLLYLDGAEVDYVETLEGSGFKFNNPQVKSTCGCGSSFSV
jgi:iron-sulfur cluster assembly protein